MSKDIEQASKHLGQEVIYLDTYKPELLVAVDRRPNRKGIGYVYDLESELPFTGIDFWNAYELSFLSKNQLPVAGVLSLAYSSGNKVIVESKSLKLYLNSFNNTVVPFKGNRAIEEVLTMINNDLSKLLDTPVFLNFYPASTKADQVTDNSDFIVLEEVASPKIEYFQENRDLLIVRDLTREKTFKYMSSLLRSNCKVTHQPDWGDVFISYTSDKTIDPADLLSYLVSFRNESHFHEEVAEAIFYSLEKRLNPTELIVDCRYTRRGGIDINPIRFLKKQNIDLNQYISDTLIAPPRKTIRQ